jgi:predicted nucleic acid-binding protein
MKRVFVDSNVFLRFFTRDDAGQYKDAAKLFRDAAAGKLELITWPPVLFEIVWTLRAAYRQPREKALEVVSAIRALPGLRLVDAVVVDEALAAAQRSGQEFADAYVVASAHEAGADEIATFNRSHFERLGALLHWD